MAYKTPSLREITSPELCLLTVFGVGLIRKMPGTWGTLFAVPLCYFIPSHYLLSVILWFVGLLLAFFAICSIQKLYGKEDASWIVIDEVLGMSLTVIFLYPLYDNSLISYPYLLLLAFIFFRLFDIWKIGLVRWADQKLPEEWGILLDDLLAAFYAALLIYIVYFSLIGFSVLVG